MIDEETQGKVAISMGYVGLAATNTATNNMLLFMRGTDDGQLRVRLEEDSGIRLDDLRERLRKALPEQVVPWLTGRPGAGRMARRRGAGPRASRFPSASSRATSSAQVMSFGSPTPVEVVVAGPDLADVRAHAAEGPRTR